MTRATFAERLYRLLLWAHPPAFRRQCGGEILQVVRAATCTATRSEILMMAGRDGLASLAREWTTTLTGPRREHDLRRSSLENPCVISCET